ESCRVARDHQRLRCRTRSSPAKPTAIPEATPNESLERTSFLLVSPPDPIPPFVIVLPVRRGSLPARRFSTADTFFVLCGRTRANDLAEQSSKRRPGCSAVVHPAIRRRCGLGSRRTVEC